MLIQMSFCGINFVPFQAKNSCCPAKKMTKSQKTEIEIAKIKVSSGAEFSGDEIALNFPYLLDFIKLDEGDFTDINRFLEDLLEVRKLDEKYFALINKLHLLKKSSVLGSFRIYLTFAILFQKISY